MRFKKILVILAFLHIEQTSGKEDKCPYRNLCHGVKCGPFTRCKRFLYDCSYQCTRDAIVTWLPQTNLCPIVHKKFCFQPQCSITNKCGVHKCVNQCHGCYAACIVNRINSTFPKNPRLIQSGYRSVEIQWDEIEDLNKIGEEKEYIFETYISRLKTRFISTSGQVKSFIRKVPRIKIDNLLVNGEIKVAIALKSRRNTILFEISPYETFKTKPIDQVKVERPGKITGLTVRKDEGDNYIIEWETPANIMNAKCDKNKSVQYRIESCTYNPIQKYESCRVIGILVGNTTKRLQSTVDAKYSMYPFDVKLYRNNVNIIKVTTVALNLEEGPTATKVICVN